MVEYLTEWWNLVESDWMVEPGGIWLNGGIALTVTSWCVCRYTRVSTPHWCTYTCKHSNLASTLRPYLANPIQSNPIDIDCQSNRKSINFIDYLSIIYRLFNHYLSIIYLSIVYMYIIINYRILIGPPLNRSKLWQTELNQLSSLYGIWYTPTLTH